MNTAYNQLAQSLRDNIIRGKWKTGRKLEPERELCSRYGFSRITVRRALRILEEENLITRRQGLGTFVNIRTRRKIPIVHGDFSRSMLEHTLKSKRLIIEQCQHRAGKELGRLFSIPPGEVVLTARRLDLIDNRPAAMDEVVIPLRHADQLKDADWQALDFTERWQRRQGLALDYESQIIEAASASGPVLKWLKVKRGHPLLLETNLVCLPGGQVAAKFITYYRYEYYQFKCVDRVIGGGQPNSYVKTFRFLNKN